MFFERSHPLVEVHIGTDDLGQKISLDDKEKVLKTIEETEKFLIGLRKEVKKMEVIGPSKTLKPGLSKEEVIVEITKFLGTRIYPDPSWDGLWQHEKTGQVVYSKFMCDPTDDGYIKGFQIAFDITTNKMICRNCDNLWKSLEPRGFKRIEDLTKFQTLYSKWTSQ